MKAKEEALKRGAEAFLLYCVYGLPTTMQAPCKISEVVGVLNVSPSPTPEYIHVQMSGTKTES